jgi:hypothetical protein
VVAPKFIAKSLEILEATMRYMLETPWGRFSEDGSRFEFDYDKLSAQTGYGIDELRSLGVLYCYHHPRQKSERTSVLVGAIRTRLASGSASRSALLRTSSARSRQSVAV